MATQRDIDRLLGDVKRMADRLDPSGAFGRTLHVEYRKTSFVNEWALTMRAADAPDDAPGMTLVTLGATKGETAAALTMIFEGMTLAVSAAATDAKIKSGEFR